MPLPDPSTEKKEGRKQERELVDAWAEAMRRREAKRKAQIKQVLDWVHHGSPRPPR